MANESLSVIYDMDYYNYTTAFISNFTSNFANNSVNNFAFSQFVLLFILLYSILKIRDLQKLVENLESIQDNIEYRLNILDESSDDENISSRLDKLEAAVFVEQNEDNNEDIEDEDILFRLKRLEEAVFLVQNEGDEELEEELEEEKHDQEDGDYLPEEDDDPRDEE
jgi:hypothetical protein